MPTGLFEIDNNAKFSIVDTFQIEKTPMEHTKTFSFSWTASKTLGARTLDYLTPQLTEIFEVIGIETIGQFIIQEDVAKHIPDKFGNLLRCYNVIDKRIGDGIALLCYTEETQEEMYISVQIINTCLSIFPKYHDGKNDFWFVDFTGDGMQTVFTKSLDFGADHIRETIGIFPFEDGVWGYPLFWTTDGENPLPFDFGFEQLNQSNPYAVKNNITGYFREFYVDEDFFKLYMRWYPDYPAFKRVNILEAVAADVDMDGIYELIINQYPFNWCGNCISLLKYDVNEKAFQVKTTTFLLFEESEEYDESNPSSDWCYPFLKQNGHEIKDVYFFK
jgi:hypothetical protein